MATLGKRQASEDGLDPFRPEIGAGIALGFEGKYSVFSDLLLLTILWEEHQQITVQPEERECHGEEL